MERRSRYRQGSIQLSFSPSSLSSILPSFLQFCSIQFSPSVMTDSLQLHHLQHARLPCPSRTLRACSNSCPLSWWCHPTISASVVPFSSRLQSFPASGSFQMSQFFASGSQRIGVLALASVLPMNIHEWFPLGLTNLISLQSKGFWRVFFNTSSKASILQWWAFFIVQLSHPYMTTGKTIALTRWTLVGKVMSLLFNMLSRLVIGFLPWSKCLLISWLQSPSAVILEPKKIKSVTVSIVSPSICHEVTGLDTMIFVFGMLSLKSAFSLSSFSFIKRLFFTFCHKGCVTCIFEVIDISFQQSWTQPVLYLAQCFSWCTLHIS